MMIAEICGHIHNWFTADEDRHAGTYAIVGGALVLPFLSDGQYFRIVGSALNDGVYRYPVDPEDGAQALADETFTGEIWAMKVPRAFQLLAGEIEAWENQYGAAVSSPYQSESVIGVYSYTKAGAGVGNGGISGASWQSAYKSRLNRWRKLR